jgi:hypothetical protein
VTRAGRSKFWDLHGALEFAALKSVKAKQIELVTILSIVWRLLIDRAPCRGRIPVYERGCLDNWNNSGRGGILNEHVNKERRID